MGIGGYDYLNEEVEISVVVDGLSFFLALANVVQFRTNLWVFLKVEAYSDKKLDSLMHMLLFISLFFLCIVRSVNIFACCCCCRRRSISKKAERVLNASSTQYEKIDSEAITRWARATSKFVRGRGKFIPALLLLLDSAYAEDWVWKRTVGDE